MPNYQCILIDDPRPAVRRVTLNRPEKRNALNNQPWEVTTPKASLITRQAAPDSGPGT